MKKQIKECLHLVWKYSRFSGSMKLVIAIMQALIIPINVIFFQKVVDDIMNVLAMKQLSIKFFSDFGMMAMMLVLEAIFTRLDNQVEIKFDVQMTDHLEKDIICKYERLDYSCYEKSLTYDIISRIAKNPSEKIKLIYWKIIEMIKLSIALIGLLLIYQRVSFCLILVFTFFLFPMLYENYRAGSLWYDLYERQTVDERKINYYERLLTNKKSLLELRIYHAIDYIERLWKKQSDLMLKEKDDTLRKVEKHLLRRSLFSALWYMSSTGVLLYSLYIGKISTGMFVALFSTTLNIVDTISGLLEVFGNFSKEIKEVSYIIKFFELKENMQQIESIKGPIKRIRFEDVYFTYPGSKTEVLSGVNFEMDLTKSTAIVGENGSGKTTIIKLLCGLYKPTKGKIWLDGQDLNNLSTREIGKYVKVVFQDFFQYELTVRENIGFGNLKEMKNDRKLKEVLELVNLHDIEEMGLEKNLGKLEENSVDLSKGQWQRLAMSRVFLDENVFAILDEPTASMDPVTENKMYQIFYSIMKSRGSLMISHRLASAKMADNILVLNKGKVIEEGNHVELMEKQGKYCNLYLKQAEWYKSKESQME